MGLVPLLLAISGQSCKKAFLLSMICGVIFFTAVFSWTFEIPRYELLHHAALGVYLALYFGVFGAVVRLVDKQCGIVAALSSAPLLWVTLEYARSNFFFLALPWALLAHSQWKYPAIIQLAALTGSYGVSFLVVLVNSALALLLLILSSKSKLLRLPDSILPSAKSAISLTLAAAALTGLALLYGVAVLSRPIKGNEIRLSALQGNIDRQIKADPKKHAVQIMQTYTNLTRQAAKDQPDLILWPEASTPGFVLKDLPLLRNISTLVAETKTPFLIGSSEYPKFVKDRPLRPEDVGNTALYFSAAGKFLGQYLKIHLVPFGEYIPYEGVIDWPDVIVPADKKTFEIPGKEYTLFSLGEYKFGAVICWEVVFPQLFRSFVKTGANFMINLTNEGWFGDSAAPYQMAAIVAMRAAENRVPVVRSANTGISCFIDAFGRITGVVKDRHNKPTYVEGYLTRSIRPSREKTFYTRYGDIFAYLCIIISLCLLFSCLIFPKLQTGISLLKSDEHHNH
jgi:apolipoprotein N-acyltransferase